MRTINLFSKAVPDIPTLRSGQVQPV